MSTLPPEELVRQVLIEKYPDDDPDEQAERFERVNNRRLWLIQHSGKTCTTCTEFKTFTEFGVDTRSPDGLRANCKSCRKATTKGKNDE